MTPHGKAHHIAHSSCSPTYAGASVRRRTPVECQSYDNSMANGKRNLDRRFACGGAPQMRKTSGRYFSTALQARLTVLREGRVQSWGQVRISGARRQIRGGSFMSPKKSDLWIGEFPSAISRSSRSPERQLNTWSSAAAATAARRSDGCRAQARRQAVLSAQLLPISCLGFDECRRESNQRQSRNGWGTCDGPRKTIYRRNGVASRRDCRAAVCARGDEPRATIPAAGYAAPGRGLRNPRSLITGSGAGLAISCSGGAAVARLAHNQEVVGSIPTPATSSGDGLGIQQPGSMTWGGFFVPTAPSGRADESAMCPAVARSLSRRAA